MNASFPILREQSYEDMLEQRIEDSRLRAGASLAHFAAEYEARTGKPFRDPEPTPEEIAVAMKRADDAVRSLIGELVGQRGEV